MLFMANALKSITSATIDYYHLRELCELFFDVHRPINVFHYTGFVSFASPVVNFRLMVLEFLC